MAELYQEIKTKNNEIFIVSSCHLDDIESLQKFFQQGAIESTHTILYSEPSLSTK